MSINRGSDKEVVHMYNGILLSHKKDETILLTATGNDLKTVKVSEVSQKEKDKYIISLICGVYKNGTDELVCKTEIELQI